MNPLIFFSLGLFGLWIGSEFITRGSLGLAKKFGLKQSFIGLVILSLGTDLPEIMVSITGAIEQRAGIDTSGLVVGNIIGSNMGQMVFVLGVVGLFGTMKLKKKEIWSQGAALISTTLLFLILSNDGLISFADGIILLLSYALYFFFASRNRNNPTKRKKTSKAKSRKRSKKALWPLLTMLMVGLAIIAQASSWVIEHGINIATDLGISQLVVGAILVGIGTSLPEMVVSLNALFKGAKELSISNLIGSNIVDILLALGLGAVISPWRIDRQVAQFDIPFLLLCMVIAIFFMISKGKIERKESFLLLSLYGVYVSLKLMGW